MHLVLALLIEDTVNKQKISKISRNSVGDRPVGYLKNEENLVEFEITQDKSIKWQGGDSNPGPPDYEFSTLPLGHAYPFTLPLTTRKTKLETTTLLPF